MARRRSYAARRTRRTSGRYRYSNRSAGRRVRRYSGRTRPAQTVRIVIDNTGGLGSGVAEAARRAGVVAPGVIAAGRPTRAKF